MEPSRLNPDMFYQPFEQDKLSSGIVITFQVMAVSRVSARHPDPVSTPSKGRQQELGAYTRGARDPDDPKIRRILKTA